MFAFIHHVIEHSLSIYHVSGLCLAQVVKEKWSLEKGKTDTEEALLSLRWEW